MPYLPSTTTAMAIRRWRAVVEWYAEERPDEWVEECRQVIREQFGRWFPLGVIERFPIVYIKPETTEEYHAEMQRLRASTGATESDGQT